MSVSESGWLPTTWAYHGEYSESVQRDGQGIERRQYRRTDREDPSSGAESPIPATSPHPRTAYSPDYVSVCVPIPPPTSSLGKRGSLRADLRMKSKVGQK